MPGKLLGRIVHLKKWSNLGRVHYVMRTVDIAKIVLKLEKGRIRVVARNMSTNNLSSQKSIEKINLKRNFTPE